MGDEACNACLFRKEFYVYMHLPIFFTNEVIHERHVHVSMLHLIIIVCNSKYLYTDILQSGTLENGLLYMLFYSIQLLPWCLVS